jgi:hypothetical protein
MGFWGSVNEAILHYFRPKFLAQNEAIFAHHYKIDGAVCSGTQLRYLKC